MNKTYAMHASYWKSFQIRQKQFRIPEGLVQDELCISAKVFEYFKQDL